VARSEKLIEFGNSWFSPKQLLGWRLELFPGVELLEGVKREKSRHAYQTPNTGNVSRQLGRGG
jgi:hypothetical protein